jgi:chromosome segregation ATPase
MLTFASLAAAIVMVVGLVSGQAQLPASGDIAAELRGIRLLLERQQSMSAVEEGLRLCSTRASSLYNRLDSVQEERDEEQSRLLQLREALAGASSDSRPGIEQNIQSAESRMVVLNGRFAGYQRQVDEQEQRCMLLLKKLETARSGE